METTLKGQLQTIFPPEQYGGLEKRVFWLTEGAGKYANTWQLEMQHQDCDILDRYMIGESVECNVKIMGRLYKKPGKEERVFNTLVCTMIKAVNK